MHPSADSLNRKARKTKSQARKKAPAVPSTDGLPSSEIFIVGIGASAGALDPISEVLRRLPKGCNFAVVLVQHLDPHHESMLVELLKRVTSLPVHWATNGQSVEAGNVYVAPPKSSLAIQEGVLLLRDVIGHSTFGDVNNFFRSLAEDCKHRAVGVVLSGNGSDGTGGAKAIKGFGGIVLAQDPSSASFPSMPRSAIDSNCVDRVLTPAGIAEELLKVTNHAPVLWNRIGAHDGPPSAGGEAEQLAATLRLITARTGVDFSEYKPTTIKRRLVRQMMLSKSADLGSYLKRLQKNRSEVDALFESMLIDVTEFFRDTEYFEFLRESILPKILAHHPENVPVRIWVPGCSTGEEAYSIGMLVREIMEDKGPILPVQIFGTDVAEKAIRAARAGAYSFTDVTGVSPERLKRFFYKSDRGYVIQKRIRDMCIFARQNVSKDSPFSRLDLISCRNLLIYFNSTLQRKLMSVFHYALNPSGYLVLGSSESVGSEVDLFRLVDRRFRIYSRKSTGRRAHFDFAVEHPATDPPPTKPLTAMPDDLKEPVDILREADRIVLHRHGPTGVLVNEDLEILQFRGDVSAYLAPTPGRASFNLVRMAQDGLARELQEAMDEAREKNVRVQRNHVQVKEGNTTKPVDVDVTPIDHVETKERFYLVLFTASDPLVPGRGKPGIQARTKKSGRVAQAEQLRQELDAARSYLQSTIQKHETTNQALRAANEEIQSSNEELQSTNEELETAKEELQSTNEELTTVNEELHNRQLELMQVNNDLHNLISSVHLPIIILGQDMRIRRFTPMAEKILKVIPTDIGRPLSDINIDLRVDDLPGMIAEVIDSLVIKEVEVQDGAGRWYSLRLRPYRTAEKKIDGVVITLIDVDVMKRSLAEAEEARNLAQAVIETTREPLVALTAELKIKSANDAFYRLFKATKERAEGRLFFEIVDEPGKLGALKRAFEGVLPTNTSLTNYEVGMDLPDVGSTKLVINVRQIASDNRTYPLILLSIRPQS